MKNLKKQKQTKTTRLWKKIVHTYKTREEIEKYSYKSTLDGWENGYNLNILIYVNICKKEDTINLKEYMKI